MSLRHGPRLQRVASTRAERPTLPSRGERDIGDRRAVVPAQMRAELQSNLGCLCQLLCLYPSNECFSPPDFDTRLCLPSRASSAEWHLGYYKRLPICIRLLRLFSGWQSMMDGNGMGDEESLIALVTLGMWRYRLSTPPPLFSLNTTITITITTTSCSASR